MCPIELLKPRAVLHTANEDIDGDDTLLILSLWLLTLAFLVRLYLNYKGLDYETKWV